MKTIMLVICGGLFFFSLASRSYAQDQVTITTYYPSPFGIYADLRANRMAVGNARVFGNAGEVTWGTSTSLGTLSNDQGSSVELGGTVGTYTPYIDFHNDNTNDYDSRIMLLNNNVLGIYVRDRVEIRSALSATDYADIAVADIYLCE